MTRDASGPPEHFPAPMADAPTADERFAAELRGFGPLGILSIFVILAGNAIVVPGSALLVLAWRWRSRTPWRDIGYVRPGSWARSVALGLALGVAFKLVMKAVVMPLFGADPVNRPYHFLAGNQRLIPSALYAMIVGAGFGEETVFRGYLFERFGRLIGTGAAARVATVLLTSAWFALAHYSTQGVSGVEQAAITGLAFGTTFALTGRLFPIMVAHAAFDLTAYALIYWNLESAVAHLVFR